ncbi:transcriptional regulator [Luteibacter sp. CQ10]|uniref:transcriptional regulator n=1 Tax=Luteibacter sp. CQ10 TaxID=2805821 RepID=UPI0034A204F1
MADFLAPFLPVADAIAALLKPHAEVVIHDLGDGTIRHIAHRLSRRSPGDDSLTDIDGIETLDRPVIGPYPKTNHDGRSMKSVTAVLRDGRGRAAGLMCINLDVSMFETLQAVSRDFLRFADATPRAAALFREDWREEVNDVVGAFLGERGTSLSAMQVDEREALVRELDARGVFDVRHASGYVARVLGVSRATLYKSLKSVRGERA